MKKKGILLSSFETQDLLALMQIYLSEWMHRDELLWKQVFKAIPHRKVGAILPEVI